MKTLGKNIQRLIKKQRFVLNTVDTTPRMTHRKGMFDLTYRMTLVDMETSYGRHVRINIKVKGKIQDQKLYDDTNPVSMRPALDVVTKKNLSPWDKSWKQKSAIWGEHYNKEIRRVIRGEVHNDIKNFLKLIGMDNHNIMVDKVNFEK